MSNPRFKIFTKPRYCPNASVIGYDKYACEVGDLVLFETPLADESTHHELGRVLGLAAGRLPDGSDPGKDTLAVMVIDEMLTFAYLRYVKLSAVVQVRAPSKSIFAQWFLSGPVPHPEVLEAASRYGCVSDNYIDKYLQDGELRKSFRDVDRVK